MSPRVDAAKSLSAGTPMPLWSLDASAASQEFDTVEVSPDLVEKFGKLFALRVIGTGMIDALINDGDVVVIKPTRCAKDGEIVVVWFKKEETTILRKFYREGDYVRLQPANSTMAPIYAPKENVEVHGKVVSVIRSARSPGIPLPEVTDSGSAETGKTTSTQGVGIAMNCPECGAAGHIRKTKTPEWRCRKCGHEWGGEKETRRQVRRLEAPARATTVICSCCGADGYMVLRKLGTATWHCMKCDHAWPELSPPKQELSRGGKNEFDGWKPVMIIFWILVASFLLFMCMKVNFVDPQRCSYEDQGVNCPFWDDIYGN
jgi:ribosomal protein L37AE/L43A